jgi:serine protease AprX
VATLKAAAGVASDGAEAARADVADAAQRVLDNQITGRFDAISGVAAGLTGAQITNLAKNGDQPIAIVPDVPVVETGTPWANGQRWVRASGADGGWTRGHDPGVQSRMPAIAIVDSGIESRADFGDRLVASVNLSRLPDNSPGDGRGHGTFVAGIAAGSGDRYTGTAPAGKLVSIDVLDDTGMGLTSDVIRAAQWILDNRDRYDIRVANFSLHSQISVPFFADPLDRAVEKLWLNGIVVVTAAGNYGSDAGPSGVVYSPADDPFVITVGAADPGKRSEAWDDGMAPWSAWGYTLDGFMKPEISAPGRYMVGPVPTGSTLVAERPDAVVSSGYMQLSGTSFAAPVVSGAAALLLAHNPGLTPDQVKGALMVSARPLKKSVGLAGGVGEVEIARALDVADPPNPNAGLNQFLVRLWGSRPVFDALSWRRVAQSNASWDSASWNSASWNSASWNSASWNSASWNSASWNSASWNSASWNSASWNSASWNSASWNSGSREDAVDRDEPIA